MTALGAAIVLTIVFGILYALLARMLDGPRLTCVILGHDWRISWQRLYNSHTYTQLECRRCGRYGWRESA